MKDPAKFSFADFQYTDNPDILSPPEEFEHWMSYDIVSHAYSFTEQKILRSPSSITEILRVDGKIRKVINMTSYNYLGLSTHPEVIASVKSAVDKYGLSSSGAPMVSGNLDIHEVLAEKIARLKEKESALIFSSGYGGNVGALQGLLRKGDLVILDEKSHKSLIDGAVLAGAKLEFFDHNNMTSLEQFLEKYKDNPRKMIVIEGVYSMDGDLAKLPEIVELSQHYKAPIYLDEAHSTLMFGKNGGGIGEHFGLEDKVGMSYGTLSKSFGGVGGFVASNKKIIRYIKSYTSSWSFSCAPSPPVVAGLITALDIATRDSSLRDKLWKNTKYLKDKLLSLNLNIGESESQVIPIIIGSSGELLFTLANEMQNRGLFLQPIDYPAVPAHLRRFRISVSSQFTQEDLDTALSIIEDVIVKGLKKFKTL